MSKTQKLSSLLAVSAATGVALAPSLSYADMIRTGSWILGYDIYTHEIPLVGPEIYRRLQLQFPDIPSREGARRDWRAARQIVLDRYGPWMIVARGDAVREKSPLDTVQDVMAMERPTP